MKGNFFMLATILCNKLEHFSITVNGPCLMRLHDSQDGGTYPGYKLICFVSIGCFFAKYKTH